MKSLKKIVLKALQSDVAEIERSLLRHDDSGRIFGCGPGIVNRTRAGVGRSVPRLVIGEVAATENPHTAKSRCDIAGLNEILQSLMPKAA